VLAVTKYSMNFYFRDSGLAKMYTKGIGANRYPDGVARAFFKKMQKIKAATNENDLRAVKGNHFEKLKGEVNKYSIRLNQGYRLVFSKTDEDELEIQEITNHYE